MTPGDNRSLIIRRLREHLAELEGFTRGLTEEQLQERPKRGQRSLYEIALHLALTQDIHIDRVALMLTERNPVMPNAGSHGLAESEEEGKSPVTVRSYIEQRKTLIALLGSLEERQWKMEGKHPQVRNYTVEKCMEELMRQEECELFEMFKVFFGFQED